MRNRINQKTRTEKMKNRTANLYVCICFRIIASIISVIVLIFAGIFSLPRLCGITPYIVQSASMEPEIPTGAVAFVNTTLQPENKGQIIAYRRSGRHTADNRTYPRETTANHYEVVLHRIVDATAEGWITRGDANKENDPDVVYPEEVVGIYLFSVPRAGFILAGMQGEEMMTASGIVLVLLVLSGLAETLS